jgi:flagellar hook-basal body complex protein FliE
MSDPLGLISGAGGLRPNPGQGIRPPAGKGDGPDFAQLLKKNLEQVNELQADASAAVEDLVAGRRNDLEGVILATEKADTAFRMLQSMRNKVMAAYEEIKQIRV